MSVEQEKQLVELKAMKLEIRTKLVWMNILKQLEAILNCIREVLTPSRSTIKNVHKLGVIGVFLTFLWLLVVTVIKIS